MTDGRILSNTGRVRTKSAAAAYIAIFVTVLIWFIIEGLFQFDIWLWAMPSLKSLSVKQYLLGGGALLISLLIAVIWVARPSDNKVEIVQN